MATVQKRKDSYLISVSCGYDTTGRQIRRTMTYKPPKEMTAKQIEKEVQRQAVLFEEQCNNGTVVNSSIKFADFAALWFEDHKKDLRPKTYARYKSMLPRINAAVGHLRLDKIQPIQLCRFYDNLAEEGTRTNVTYKCNLNIAEYLKTNKLSAAKLARDSGIAATTVSSLKQDKPVSHENAVKLSEYFGKPIKELFTVNGNIKPLAPKTILHHHRLISSILSTAVQWNVLAGNPCERTKPPKVEKTDLKFLDEVQAAALLDLLEYEEIQYKTMIRVLLFTGLRCGELLGLEWSDIDFDNKTLSVSKSSLYLPERGIFDDTTKNTTSNRVIKLSQTAITDLKKYQVWQTEQRLLIGDHWKNSKKIFTTTEGGPLHPDILSSWFSKFVKAHADVLPSVTVHSLRHTNATLQIAGGVPLTTVAKRLGHANTVTTSVIYAHAIKSADEAAAETLENLLTPTKNRSVG